MIWPTYGSRSAVMLAGRWKQRLGGQTNRGLCGIGILQAGEGLTKGSPFARTDGDIEPAGPARDVLHDRCNAGGRRIVLSRQPCKRILPERWQGGSVGSLAPQAENL